MEGLTLAELAALVGGSLDGTASEGHRIFGVNTLLSAGPHEASFLANGKYRDQVEESRAGVILVAHKERVPEHKPVIRVGDPYLAFCHLQRAFHPQPVGKGRHHPSAAVHERAHVEDGVDIGAHAVIEAGARIGRGTIIGAGCVIGRNVAIGEDCLLHAGVRVAHGCQLGDRVIVHSGAVIGSDGFGYAWDGSRHLKIPQTGRVIIHDDVEIGANCCIDRGALGDTVIEQGVKLDNLIQVGHNVHIGAHSIIASQTGISGSTRLGAGCQVGGQVGFAGHLSIAPGCRIAAQSGVMNDLERGTYGGTPAMPHRAWMRMVAMMQKLPEIVRNMRK